MGFHAFHKPDFPPSQIRLCVAGFMTRYSTHLEVNKAGTALPSLRLLALANRVEGRPRYIDSEGARKDCF